jgi:hypothetical protein
LHPKGATPKDIIGQLNTAAVEAAAEPVAPKSGRHGHDEVA